MGKKHKKSTAGKKAAKLQDDKPQKLSRKDYEKELEKLQGELVKLQFWVRKTGAKVIIVFEGRDAAGKGCYQAHHGAGQSAGIQGGCAAGTLGAREDPAVYATLLKTFPGGERSSCLIAAGTTVPGSSG